MRIYTDASTRQNISGIAFVVTDNRDNEKYTEAVVINEKDNNTAELKAILFALNNVKNKNEHITILTDSSYAIQAIRSGYCRKNEVSVLEKIYNYLNGLKCNIFWIKGHCQDGTMVSYFNKQADKACKKVRKDYERLQTLQKRLKIQELRNKKFR